MQFAYRASRSRAQLVTERRLRPSCRSTRPAGLARVREQISGEIRRMRQRSWRSAAPAGSIGRSIGDVRAAWLARKRMPALPEIHSCRNALTCGPKNGFPQIARQTLCQIKHAKSSTARCRCGRRRKCPWKKAQARKARAAWESTRAACAEKQWSQAHERLVMTIFVPPYSSL